MNKFDTKVQEIKYKVLKQVAAEAWNDTLLENFLNIPKILTPENVATVRCCINKERNILAERVKLAMGGDRDNPNNIEVIEEACDKCPASGYTVVADSCRTCLAHNCEHACKFGAIYFDHDRRANIDKDKCRSCGLCASNCSFSAIIKREKPCVKACKVGAISAEGEKSASIDNSKCIQCGACVYKCPFGAITDKSYILNVIDMLKKSRSGQGERVYAVVAPAIYGQFNYATTGQVVSGILQLGFYNVVEAALGADMVALSEAKELSEKGFLTSSCCPSFVEYIKKTKPSLEKHMSHSVSPMVEISRLIKEKDKAARVVFIGPCTAKKGEVQKGENKKWVDEVITFEELQALFASRDISIETLPEQRLDDASYYGRIFARSGGLSEAAKQAIKEQGIDFEIKSIVCDGIEECIKVLNVTEKKLGTQTCDYNFIEGMACTGGCISGAGCLTHSAVKNKLGVDKFGLGATEKSITDAVKKVK